MYGYVYFSRIFSIPVCICESIVFETFWASTLGNHEVLSHIPLRVMKCGLAQANSVILLLQWKRYNNY